MYKTDYCCLIVGSLENSYLAAVETIIFVSYRRSSVVSAGFALMIASSFKLTHGGQQCC